MFLFSQVHKTADYSQLHLQLDLLEGRKLELFFCCCCFVVVVVLFFCCFVFFCCFLPMEHANTSPAMLWGRRINEDVSSPLKAERKKVCLSRPPKKSQFTASAECLNYLEKSKEWYHLDTCVTVPPTTCTDSGVPWLVTGVCNLHTCTCSYIVVYFLSKCLIKTCRRARFSKGAQIFPWNKFWGSRFFSKVMWVQNFQRGAQFGRSLFTTKLVIGETNFRGGGGSFFPCQVQLL